MTLTNSQQDQNATTTTDQLLDNHDHLEKTIPNSQTDRIVAKKKKESLKSVVSTILLLILAPVLALFMIMFVFRSYQVDGPSMLQTLQDNDRLIIYKLPKTIADIRGKSYIPKRGEIIVFKETETLASGKQIHQELIKRVMALPGERIVIKEGVVTVYNSDHPDGFQPDKDFDFKDGIPRTDGSIDMVVPDDTVFVCGDNRTVSKDSRIIGPVKSSDIVGVLKIRIAPVGSMKWF